ncbi:lysozyme g-like [Bombina bombina]|uniref:lysozyme g-like n=1 Tax=Bombina bombina TaxID=8345 RepID=UPI00235ACCE0|nr:lysozyme g-like [Bombina bombina]
MFLRRNCSDDDSFLQESKHLSSIFFDRGYDPGIIQRAFNDVKSQDRSALLDDKPKSEESKDKPTFVTTYSSQYYAVCNIIHMNLPFLLADDDLKDEVKNGCFCVSHRNVRVKVWICVNGAFPTFSDHQKGVSASYRMAQNDSARIQKYRAVIEKVAEERDIDPAVIAGIISRESRAGAALRNDWGDHENAFGLMQVDKNYHDPKGKWYSEEHLKQLTGMLIEMIEGIKKKFPKWTPEQHLKGGIAAYNCGLSKIQSYEQIDNCTTGHDYSNDVVARAQWYKKNGY